MGIRTTTRHTKSLTPPNNSSAFVNFITSTDTSITGSWYGFIDNVAIDHYIIKVVVVSSGSIAYTSSNLSSSTSEHTATGLTSNIQYYYNVYAYDAAGNSSTVSFMTTTPTTTTTSPYTYPGRITNNTDHVISGGTVFIKVNTNTNATFTLGTLSPGQYIEFSTTYFVVLYGATFELQMYSTTGIVNTNYATISQGSGPYTGYFNGAGDAFNPADAIIVTTGGPQYNLMFSIY